MTFNNDNNVVHRESNPLRQFVYRPTTQVGQGQSPSWLNGYLLLVIAANFFCIFMKSHGGDMGFWSAWTTHLTEKGYRDFDGNYPPVYIHWLYICGKFMDLVGLTIDSGLPLKFLSQLPITLAHLILVWIIYSLLAYKRISGGQFHFVMLLTAINPAILFDGPVWGQVDLLPTISIVLALYLLILGRCQVFVLPLFTLALLTKFQAIAFAPVFAIVFFRNFRDTLVGCILSLGLIAIVLLPFLITESVVSIIHQAYIQTLGQYPYATFNAGNIWMLVAGNRESDAQILFGFSADSWLGSLFTIKNIGMLLFAIVCLWVFVLGILRQRQQSRGTLNESSMHLPFYALICSTAFFVLLPGMHERYLIPAVIVALVCSAIRPEHGIYAAVLTIIALLNMTQVHAINSSNIWSGISWFVVFVFLVALLDLSHIIGRFESLIRKLKVVLSQPYIPAIVFLTATLTMVLVFIDSHRLEKLVLESEQVVLTDLEPRSVSQGFGRLHINRNVTNTALSINGKKYSTGLGTHAQSRIVYNLPEGSVRLQFIAGLDDAAPQGEVQFLVYGDGKVLWRSAVVRSNLNNPVIGDISLQGIKTLDLVVDSRGTIHQDHANWVNPVITIER